MINESYIGRLNFFETRLCSLIGYDIEEYLFTFSKLQAICFYLIYSLRYLSSNMVAPYHKTVKVYSLDLELAKDLTPPGGCTL